MVDQRLTSLAVAGDYGPIDCLLLTRTNPATAKIDPVD